MRNFEFLSFTRNGMHENVINVLKILLENLYETGSFPFQDNR